MNKIRFMMTALCAMVVLGCQKELTGNKVQEGMPASLDITVNLGRSENMQMTKGVQGYESQINELMLIMFEENGRKMVIDLTGNLQEGSAEGTYGGGRTYTLVNPVTTDIDGNELLSGTYKVYAVANWSSPFCGLTKDGLASMSEEELKNSVALNAGAVIRVSGDDKFPMTGYSEGQTVQPDENGESSIEVSLKRLIAHIEFNFVNDTSADNTENPRFTPYTFSVYNIPTGCYLMSQGTGEGDNAYDCGKYGYIENINVNAASGIEFFMLENVQAKPDGCTDYASRDSWTNGSSEKETLPMDKSWKYAPENSTFVVVSGEYEGTSYTGRVAYTIHLGNFSGTNFGNSASGYDNFIVNRNEYQKYTVTIKGVSNIVAEASLEDGEGSQPGAEGTITTISKTAQFVLDAHYETGILSFSIPQSGLSNPTIIIKSPYTAMERFYFDDKNLSSADYGWVTFTKPAGTSSLAAYPGTGDSKLTDIIGLGNALKSPSSSSSYYLLEGPTDGMYTVYVQAFVNEYFYEDKPWTEFVNADNRMLVFNPDVNTSPDGNTLNFPTYLFQISQRSIKTTYATTDATINAFGIETWNETGKMSKDKMDSTNDTDYDSNNGWTNSKTLLGTYNTWPNLGYTTSISDNSKDSHVFYSSGDGISLSSGYYACLTRNRDENGDGNIDETELKWYVPAVNQFFTLWMGQDYLHEDTQLFDPSLISTFTQSDETKYNLLTSSGGANGEYWAVEGASVGTIKNTIGVRCVRNLLTYNGEPEENSIRSGNVITVTGASAIRTTKMTGEYASGHSERDADNILPAAFEVASSDLSGTYTIAQVRDDSLCADYSQDDDAADKGQWRIPNQRELMLIKQWGILGNVNKGYASRTFFSARNNTGFSGKKIEPFAYNPSSGRFTLTIGSKPLGSDSNGAYTIRCVRDATPATVANTYDGYLEGGSNNTIL